MDEKLIPDRADDELCQLALDVVSGHVFGSWNLHKDEGNLLPCVFLPILFIENRPENLAHVYEYLSAAGRMSVNGYPTFFSLRMLNQHDEPILFWLIQELQAEHAAFVNRHAG